jgi:translation initiation factor 2B subunit (eIF-2B alpha/beta/delta family)
LAQNNQINWTQARKLQDRIVKTENREIRSANRRIVAEIDKLPLKPQQKTQIKADLKAQVLTAPPDVNLQELVDVAVQRQVDSIQNQRATSAQRRIASALKKVAAFADLEDDELDAKASELIQNPTLINTIKMDDSVKRAINNAIKSLER